MPDSPEQREEVEGLRQGDSHRYDCTVCGHAAHGVYACTAVDEDESPEPCGCDPARLVDGPRNDVYRGAMAVIGTEMEMWRERAERAEARAGSLEEALLHLRRLVEVDPTGDRTYIAEGYTLAMVAVAIRDEVDAALAAPRKDGT